MDHKNPRSMASHHPGPFRSPLNAHLDLIRSLRRARKTWAEIAKHLTELNRASKPDAPEVHPSTVFNFYKRHIERLERQRRKGKMGAQPLGFEPVPGEPDYPGSPPQPVNEQPHTAPKTNPPEPATDAPAQTLRQKLEAKKPMTRPDPFGLRKKP